MNEIGKRRIFSLLVVGLLVLSVLTAATAVVSAEQNNTEKPTTENNDTIKNEFSGYDMKDMPTEEELKERMNNILKDFQKNGNEKKLDLLDPEKQKMLEGISNPSAVNKLMTDASTKTQHNVDDVHDMGYMGEDVKVSLMDTGFDMAQPDLRGKHAVFHYNETTMPGYLEQYDGYPIAYDPTSMADYVISGQTSSVSWYVNTSYEAQAYDTSNMGMVAVYDEKPPMHSIYSLPDTVDDKETVRFGMHPDDKLEMWYGEKPAVLLVKDDATNNWTHVYVDLDNDRSFRDETAAHIDGTDPDSECISQDIDDDGIGDISGGMVYFISNYNSDGEKMPIPYSQHFRPAMNRLINLALGVPPGYIEFAYGIDAWTFIGLPDTLHTTPNPGDLICLMGDFNAPGSYGAHGTWTATAVAGQGVTGVPGSTSPPDPDGGDGIVQGMAPDVEIIPLGHFFDYPPNSLAAYDVTYSSIFFAAEGYDGNVDTHDDQAQIASSSFGNSYPVNVGGHNYYDRLMDWVGSQYTENTLFINSEGNEGSAFGTMGAPAGGQGILSVGASSNQYYRVDSWNAYDGGPNPSYGEVTGMTSRGPDCIGAHGPDILTNGQYGYGGDPLNNHAWSMGEFGGNDSYALWSGTSLSAPNAAGIAALVYQAYWENHGMRPSNQMVKKMIMQGADNLKNSPFAQGPGIANALKSVNLAMDEQGLFVPETSEWRPGVNPTTGTPTEHNVNMMEPGESVTDSLTLHNMAGTAVDYSVNPVHLEHVGTTTLTLESGTMDHPVFLITSDGVYDMEGNMVAELDVPDADLFRFGAHTPYDNLGATSLVEFHDWTDVNGNGSYDGFDERNRIGYCWAAYGGTDQTSDYFEIHDPMERTHDGIVVKMRYYGGDSFEFNLAIEQYNEVAWDWISVNNGTGSIVGDDTVTFDMTAEIPVGTPKGFYGGKALITDETNGHTSVMPITITVGETEDGGQLDLMFGANEGDFADDTGIYRNDRVYGSWDGAYPRSGDWRYYYFYLDNPTSSPVAMNLHYDRDASDIEAYLLGAGTYNDAFSWTWPSRYGAYEMQVQYQSDKVSGNVGAVTEGPLNAGMYMIAVHSKQISGMDNYQMFEGEIYTVGEIATEYSEEYMIDSMEDYNMYSSGKLPVIVRPDFDAPNATLLTKPPSLSSTDVWTDTVGAGNALFSKEAFIEQGTLRKITVIDLKRLYIEIVEAESSDLDLALLKDADGDGELTMADTLVGYHGIGGSLEHFELENPADGTYWASVQPYAAAAGDEFTAEIVKEFKAAGVEWGVDDMPDSFTAGQAVGFNITYTLPASHGGYGSWMSIGREGFERGIVLEPQVSLIDGMPGHFEMSEDSPMSIRSPGDTIAFNYVDPHFYSGLDYGSATFYVNGEQVPSSMVSVDRINEQIILAKPFNLPNGVHTLQAMCHDAAGNTITSSMIEFEVAKELGVDLSLNPLPECTNSAIITISGTTTPGASVHAELTSTGETFNFIVNDDGTFIGQVRLNSGRNVIDIIAMNDFGNTEVIKKTIESDFRAPSLTIDSYPEEVHSDTVAISGSVDELSAVWVGGVKANTGSSFMFHANVNLVEGHNTIMVVAEDMAGNLRQEEIMINYVPTYATQEDVEDMSNAISNNLSDLEGMIEEEMDMFHSSMMEGMDNLEMKLNNLQDTAYTNRRNINEVSDQLGDTQTQLSNTRSAIGVLQNKNDDLSDQITENSNEIGDLNDQMLMINGGLLIILLIVLIVVYGMLSRKIGKIGAIEEEMPEEEMFEEEEEEMFEEEEFGEEPEEEEMFEEEEEEMFEEDEEEMFEEPEDIFEDEEEEEF